MGDSNKMNSDENQTPCKVDSEGYIVPKRIVAATYFGGLFLAMLIAMLIAMGIFCGFHPGMLMLFWVFPMGLIPWIPAMGYVIYFFMFVGAFVYREKSFFMKLLVVYVILLCLNIVGFGVAIWSFSNMSW